MPISSLNENTLEVLNLYFFFKIFKKKDKTSINSIENALIDSNSNLNKIIYYHKIEKIKLLKNIFFINNINIKNDVIVKKVNILTENIKKDINKFLLTNKNEINEESSESEDSLKEEDEEVDDPEEQTEKLLMFSKSRSPSIEFLSVSENDNLNKDSKTTQELDILKTENLANEEKKIILIKKVTIIH